MSVCLFFFYIFFVGVGPRPFIEPVVEERILTFRNIFVASGDDTSALPSVEGTSGLFVSSFYFFLVLFISVCVCV